MIFMWFSRFIFLACQEFENFSATMKSCHLKWSWSIRARSIANFFFKNQLSVCKLTQNWKLNQLSKKIQRSKNKEPRKLKYWDSAVSLQQFSSLILIFVFDEMSQQNSIYCTKIPSCFSDFEWMEKHQLSWNFFWLYMFHFLRLERQKLPD